MTNRVRLSFMGLNMLLFVVLMAVPAQAVTFLWDGGGADNNWSSAANWNPDTSAPVSASSTVVQLDGTNRVTATQDIAAPFVLNRLDFSNGPAGFNKPISGS